VLYIGIVCPDCYEKMPIQFRKKDP
jgi:hypothetical protein